MTEMSVLQDFDMFFYHGQNDLNDEIKSEVMTNIMQPKRSLFYDRSMDAAGVHDYENKPDGMVLRIGLPYDIVNSLAKRNQYVSNGENGTKDRRVAVSQSTIRLEGNRQDMGNIKVTVLYIPMHNFKQTESISVAVGT